MSSHINSILEISRQDQVGPLSPWFMEQLKKNVGTFFPTVDQVQKNLDATVAWCAAYREQTGVSTAVMGISGGVDSATTAAILKKAGWRVIGFALPIHQDPTETERGREAAEALDIEFQIYDVSKVYDALVKDFGENIDNTLTDPNLADDVGVKIRRGNLRARARMMALYNVAHANNGLVASTDNLSELQAGFWTLHGDVGDISPIQSFNKSWEVPMMAKLAGVPEATWRAKPTDGLGIDAGDEAQLGCTYLEWDLMYLALSSVKLISSMRPVRKEFILGVLGKEHADIPAEPFKGDARAETVFEAVYNRSRRTWFKRMNPVNFEHPQWGTLQNTAELDKAFFHPEVVR